MSKPLKRDDLSCFRPERVAPAADDLTAGIGGATALFGLSTDELVSVSLPDSDVIT